MELNKWTKKEIEQGKRAFINMAKHLVPEFEVNERNKNTINDLFFYFHKLEGGQLDPTKGLWIEGPIGTGKSTLMNIFANHLRRFWTGLSFKIYNCTSVSNEFSSQERKDGLDVLDRYIYNRCGFKPNERVSMCFDELGREPIPAVHFGQRLNVMEHIMHLRYTFWQAEGLLTYVTTNLDANKVEELYGDYIRDRRAEMFNIIAMTGESRRK